MSRGSISASTPSAKIAAIDGLVLGQLVVAAGVHRGAIDAAVDDRGADGADLALGARQPAAVVHHAVEQRRAVRQRLDVMRQHQHIVRNLGVGRRDLERFQLLGARLGKVERRDVGLPVGNGRW